MSRRYHSELKRAAFDPEDCQVFSDERRQMNLYRAQTVLEQETASLRAQLQAAKEEIFGDGSKTSVALRLQAAHRTLERIRESVDGALDGALAALERATIEARSEQDRD